MRNLYGVVYCWTNSVKYLYLRTTNCSWLQCSEVLVLMFGLFVMFIHHVQKKRER